MYDYFITDDCYDPFEPQVQVSPEYLFVYGTMKRDFRNHSRISSEITTKYLGDHVTEDNYYHMKSKLINGGTAPVLFLHGEQAISGELYKINHNLLDYIDIMEGTPNVYRRVGVRLKNVHLPVWMYVVDNDEEHFTEDFVEVHDGIATYVES